ncbi:MAG: type II toxin-antitoxin system VapC family toxin [Gemmatimonadales bacterium]|nr:type II toxin-antitoxin system VapC family toxin [Gemmatimonadales bacterium]
MKGLLLDTHCLLWLLGDPGRFRAGVVERIEAEAGRVHVSLVSYWEIALKAGTGRLRLAPGFEEWLPRRVAESGLRTLDIRAPHLFASAALPRHHADAFDRLLLAQAQAEGLALVTADPAMAAYAVPVVEAG